MLAVARGGLWPWMAEGRPAGSQKMQEELSAHLWEAEPF
jgi:hypothetical protein